MQLPASVGTGAPAIWVLPPDKFASSLFDGAMATGMTASSAIELLLSDVEIAPTRCGLVLDSTI